MNDVEAAIKGMLAPKFQETIQGRVEVRQMITISKMLIAGCYVLEGKITNTSKVRVVRDGIVINEDEIDTLRRFKDDVKEVAAGYECGVLWKIPRFERRRRVRSLHYGRSRRRIGELWLD